MSSNPMTTKTKVTIMAWGFKHGAVPDSKYLFDLRSLRNPHRNPRFRSLTGLHPDVAKDVFDAPGALMLLSNAIRLVSDHIRHFEDDLTVIFACTGGRHRSVAFVYRMAEELRAEFDANLEIRVKTPMLEGMT